MELIMPPARKPTAATKAPTPKKGTKTSSTSTTAQAKAATAPKPSSSNRGLAAAKVMDSQATVTLRHLAADLAEAHDLPKKHAEAILADLVSRMTDHLTKGDKIRLTGLGILVVRNRPARTGRNPATGEAIQIAASKKVAFRPAKELKEAV
jgi:DNA-binding protein HU-beta